MSRFYSMLFTATLAPTQALASGALPMLVDDASGVFNLNSKPQSTTQVFFVVTSWLTYLKINSAGPECRFNHIIRNGKQFVDIAEDNYELCGISPAVTQGITYLVVNPAVFPHSRLECHDIQTQFNLAGLFGRILTLECSHSHVFCLTSCAITPSRATRVVSLNRPLSLQSGMTQRQRSLVLITRHSRSGCTTHVRLHLSIIGWKLTSIKIQHPGSWHDGKYLAVFHDRRRWLGE